MDRKGISGELPGIPFFIGKKGVFVYDRIMKGVLSFGKGKPKSGG
jgi:hypothetical protein